MEGLPHLELERANLRTGRRRSGAGRKPTVLDPEAHAGALALQLSSAVEAQGAQRLGYDPRRLLKLRFEGMTSRELEAIPGFSVVSEERGSLVVLFASDAALLEFRTRLETIRRGEKATRADLLYAVKAVDCWSAADRLGPALKAEGVPVSGEHLVDVELWPLERNDERSAITKAFERFCSNEGIPVLDRFDRARLILFRLRIPAPAIASVLLEHRDIRSVDLPPRYQLDAQLLDLGVETIASIGAPTAGAPRVVVLDTGIVSAHPLLSNAVGEAAGFTQADSGADEHGHGTAVAGLALYGDVEASAHERRFEPQLWLLSGRLFDVSGAADQRFLENAVVEAVDYFKEKYGARVFCLSLGDARKPFDGVLPGPLASTLDELTRTRGVLFVVPSGNFRGERSSIRWATEYPRYLLEDGDSRLLDPAPAMNVLTVGALAKHDLPRQAQRMPDSVQVRAVARRDQPSPFTRVGPGAANCIKPDLVEYAGNVAVDADEREILNATMGELTLNARFVENGLFVDKSGTSFAAPKVAHAAARLLHAYPTATPNLLRALLAASANVPLPTRELVGKVVERLALTGHGRPDLGRALFSQEDRVTLSAEAQLAGDANDFYELPMPDAFVGGSARERVVRVALAHSPSVRPRRAQYRASRFSFGCGSSPASTT